MITLQAPYELIATTIYLPSPTFSNTFGLGVEVNQKVSVNDVRYTYVKKKGHSKLNYTFSMSLGKIQELQAFVELYLTNYVRLTTHEGDIWRARMVNDPFTYGYKTRDERAEVVVTFTGVRVYVAVVEC